MEPERWRRVRELFEAALDLPEAERDEFVGVAATADPEVLEEVRRMLAADARESAFVDVPDSAAAAAATPPPLPAARLESSGTGDSVEGTVIGSYVLRRVIASGGMGTVYEAEQERPRRRVALKMLRTGLHSSSALRRFQYESEILARLRHPGIAQVYEAGTHAERVGPQTYETPWYAMEYVEGAQPLGAYADVRDLSVGERLALFLQVVEAVHYGHQKGVIHRDLKPGNILVDAAGRVKVIDFGIARATNADELRRTMQTEAGEILGTLQYMSPEQLDSDKDVDTRTDVYALGMVLYELLCRRLPYDVDRKAIHEAARIIQESAPARPSTILRSLSGDVEAICLKALEKEPRRRYASAEAFGTDIRRFLASEPIDARPPSVAYQLSMFARRNRALVGAAGAVALVLVGATVVSVHYAIAAGRARKDMLVERDDALHARDAEARERTRAETAERSAEERLAEAQEQSRKSSAVSEYLAELLSTAHPGKGGREARVTDLLTRARVEIGTRFVEWPDVRAELHGVMGSTYMGLGLLTEAEDEIRGAIATLDEAGVPDDAVERLELELDLSAALYRLGELAESEATILGAVERIEATYGPGSGIALEARSNLAALRTEQGRFEEAEALHLEAIEGLREVFGPNARSVLAAQERYTGLLLFLDRLDEAEPLARAALESKRAALGEDHIETLVAAENLAVLLRRRGDLDGAIELLEDLVARSRRHLGEQHDQTLTAVSQLADTLREAGRLEEAEPLARLALDLHVARFGEDHQDTPPLMEALAGVLQIRRKFEEAEEAYRAALEISRRVLGPEHGRTHMTAQNLASVLWMQGRSVEAETLARAAIEGLARTFGEENVFTLRAQSQRANMLWQLERRREALDLLRDTLEVQTRVFGERDFDRLQSLCYLAQLTRSAGDPREAERLYREALRLQTEVLGASHHETLFTLQGLMLVLEELGRVEEALELAGELVRGREEVFGDLDANTLTARDSLARLLRTVGEVEEAQAIFEQNAADADRVLGPEHILTSRFRLHLGDCLAALGRLDEAVPHVRAGFAGIEALLGPGHPVTLQAAHAATQLFEARGEEDEAARYRSYLSTRD